jgi:hypothetical protein
MWTGLVEMKVWMRPRLAGQDRLAGAIDVLEAGARQAADDGILHDLRDFRTAFEIAVRGNRKSRLDDVDAHRIEQFGDFQFLFERHGSARRLLAVAQCRVEYSYRSDFSVFVLMASIPSHCLAALRSLLSHSSPKRARSAERHRLGAAKEEKLRARQIEGRTDHRSECARMQAEDSATRIRMRKNRHSRIAVPPAEFTVR